MSFGICTINIHVSIRVRGLHLVWVYSINHWYPVKLRLFSCEDWNFRFITNHVFEWNTLNIFQREVYLQESQFSRKTIPKCLLPFSDSDPYNSNTWVTARSGLSWATQRARMRCMTRVGFPLQKWGVLLPVYGVKNYTLGNGWWSLWIMMNHY